MLFMNVLSNFLLKRRGIQVNKKRVHRLYCEEGLQIQAKHRRRPATAAIRRPHRTSPQAPNVAWRMDSVSDQTAIRAAICPDKAGQSSARARSARTPVKSQLSRSYSPHASESRERRQSAPNSRNTASQSSTRGSLSSPL